MMANGLDSLPTLYKQQLRSLNPSLPQVIEHFVSVNILTRTEATRLLSSSDQFSRLCQQLASKGSERKAVIISEIESFQRNRQALTAEKSLRETSVQRHHKHTSTRLTREGVARHGRKRDGDGGGKSKDLLQSAERTLAMEIYDTQNKALAVDMFFIQFYTFIIQLFWGSGGEGSPEPSTFPAPVWLQLDLSRDQVLTYLPSHLRRSLKNPSDQDKLQSISLSSLLSAFKNHIKKHDTLVHENKLLAGKAKLVQSLTIRNAHLEDEIWKCRKLADTSPPNDTRHSLAVTLPVEGEAETIRELRKKLVTLQSRIKELTAINEQWALESQEKASEMKIVQIQLDDAEAEVASLQSKLKSYREQGEKQCADRSRRLKLKTVGTEGQGAGWEVARGLEVQLQLQQERDQAVEENIHLKAELEEAKRREEEDQDKMEELRDRADNLKVQAQSKLPTLKELTALTSENRQLREKVEIGRAEREALMQKISELESKSQCSTQLCNGTEHNHLSSGTTCTRACGTNKSGILVQPLPNDDLACLSDDSTSSTAPIFFDATPLAPQKTASCTQPSHNNQHTKTDPTYNGEAKDKQNHTLSAQTNIPPCSPPPPNQPVAEIVGGLRLSVNERLCPVCHTVFMMLGEREFQSHVAGCCHTL